VSAPHLLICVMSAHSQVEPEARRGQGTNLPPHSARLLSPWLGYLMEIFQKHQIKWSECLNEHRHWNFRKLDFVPVSSEIKFSLCRSNSAGEMRYLHNFLHVWKIMVSFQKFVLHNLHMCKWHRSGIGVHTCMDCYIYLPNVRMRFSLYLSL
jgi:hypothetical protein